MRRFNRLRSVGGSGRLRNVGVSAGDHLAPTLLSTTVAANGTTLTFVFSEPMIGSGGAGTWELTRPNASIIASTYASGEGTNTWVYTAAETIYDNEVLVLYSSVPNGFTDLAGNPLADIVEAVVTNNSTAWQLDFLTGYQGGIWPHDAYAAGGLWQDAGKTTPATAVDHPVKVITDAHYPGGIDLVCSGTGWLLKQTAGLKWYLQSADTSYYTGPSRSFTVAEGMLLVASAKCATVGAGVGTSMIGLGAGASGEQRNIITYDGTWFFHGYSAGNWNTLLVADTSDHTHIQVTVPTTQAVLWQLDGGAPATAPNVDGGPNLISGTGVLIYGARPGILDFAASGSRCYGSGAWKDEPSAGERTTIRAYLLALQT